MKQQELVLSQCFEQPGVYFSSLMFRQVPRGSSPELLVHQDDLWSPAFQMVQFSKQERALVRSCTHISTAHALQGHSTPGPAPLLITDWKAEILKINDCCFPTLLIPLRSGFKQPCRGFLSTQLPKVVKLKSHGKEMGPNNNCSSQKTHIGH